MEIERKFLLAARPENLSGAPSQRLRQGYLVTCADGETRLRDADGALTLTVKSGVGRSREEWATPLSAEQFEALWPATAGRRVEKRRYQVAVKDFVAEVDIYEGSLAGLEVVEVEFAGETEADTFAPPPWFGLEVTEDAGYKNASLALIGLPR